MTLGQHIITLRKEKKLSQSEPGKRAGAFGDLIGRYERDEIKPTIDVIRMLYRDFKTGQAYTTK